ncbi:hypothetical protein AVEN_148895-1 [Araneus ventricosus]|uniref:Uncharacterized protein n=1 Tax=Araneus ventricosus TaxID=182803 RepID=A0A4Y2DJX2_ARAVE|nr:hypothetical protein AVEN_148895-1 [Araneus ventricosus]
MECSSPFGVHRSTSFQFSSYTFRWVIHEGSTQTTYLITFSPLGLLCLSFLSLRIPERASSLLHSVVFVLVREHRSPSSGPYFSFMTECAKWIKNNIGFPNFSTSTVRFSSNIRIDDGFRCETLQMV